MLYSCGNSGRQRVDAWQQGELLLTNCKPLVQALCAAKKQQLFKQLNYIQCPTNVT